MDEPKLESVRTASTSDLAKTTSAEPFSLPHSAEQFLCLPPTYSPHAANEADTSPPYPKQYQPFPSEQHRPPQQDHYLQATQQVHPGLFQSPYLLTLEGTPNFLQPLPLSDRTNLQPDSLLQNTLSPSTPRATFKPIDEGNSVLAHTHSGVTDSPSLLSFRSRILELNPRLPPYLADRLAFDQDRRFKRLVKLRINHKNACAEKSCPSGDFCSAIGGEAKSLSLSRNWLGTIVSRYLTEDEADVDNEDQAGLVTPDSFPDGIPLPPTKTLPARFECPLCFQVKSFQKPSDWTKHVQEDVQPYSCTFSDCTDPKSFKRRSDWVRHENERHRQLEWWECCVDDCQYICHRRDNFVQHLVREHKRREPKSKSRSTQNAKPRNTLIQKDQDIWDLDQEFWDLIDKCRRENPTPAWSERCRFCNNNCGTWKKFYVHVGKHMEHIAMPVVDLVDKHKVDKDTTIRSIEPTPFARSDHYSSRERTSQSNGYMDLSAYENQEPIDTQSIFPYFGFPYLGDQHFSDDQKSQSNGYMDLSAYENQEPIDTQSDFPYLLDNQYPPNNSTSLSNVFLDPSTSDNQDFTKAQNQTSNAPMFHPNAFYSPESKVKLHLRGDLDKVSEKWSNEEVMSCRKIVVFEREQEGNNIYVSFTVLSQDEWYYSPLSVSCIWWAQKKEAYITSIDIILLLEGVIATQFTVEEIRRIRLYQETFKPDTVSKVNPDTEDFFKVVIGFPIPKPHIIETDIKIFPWRFLSHILQLIFSKHSQSSNNVRDFASSEFMPATDSGYASWHPPEQKTIVNQEPFSAQLPDQSQLFDAIETMTTYSDGASIDTTRRDDFVQKFAELLLKDLNHEQLDDLAELVFCDGIDEMLADFATRLGQGASAAELLQVMVFIHKYRRSVSKVLQQMTHSLSGHDSEQEDTISDKPPLHEIMQMWHDRRNDLDSHVPADEELESIDSPLETLSDPFGSYAENYEHLIAAAPAYQWLLSSLRNRILLTAASDGAVNQIRAEVCRYVAKPANLSKVGQIQLAEVQFEMYWDFVRSEDIDDEQAMDSILTITGSEQEAQALTCAEYIQQTWPIHGMLLWRLVKDAVLHPGKLITSEDVDAIHMSIRFSAFRVEVEITALRGVIIEAAEQLCWMSGVLNSAFSTHNDGVLLCLPSLKRIYTLPKMQDSWERLHITKSAWSVSTELKPEEECATIGFKISMEYEKIDSSTRPGTCWQYLFKNCVVVRGFPIRRRSNPELGLELSLDLISKLTGTKYIYRFDEHLFFKQFSMMLTPSSQADGVLTWHLCRSKDGDRISYLDDGMRDLPKIGYEGLAKLRHVIGWCSNIKHFAGHVAGNYDINRLVLDASPVSGSLYNCQLSFGRPIHGGEKEVHFSTNHQRVHSSKRNYLDMLRFLERRFIVLWDIGTSRGWLVGGLRGLLHLLRQSFTVDKTEDSGGLFVLKPKDLLEPTNPCSARAAREFLSQPKNLSAKVSISAIHGESYEYETLGERFERIYDVIEQAFDYQSRRRNWNEISRSYLEGWDFLSLARKDDTIPPSMITLPSIGKSWVDLIRAIGAVTLIGDGFGEILQPGTPNCDSMPSDRFCLAVSVSDLEEITRVNRCKLSMKPRLICQSPLIMWHSPLGSSVPCNCVARDERKDRPVQVMWPAGQAALLPTNDDNFTLEGRSNGAVIFGHDDSLQHYTPDFGPIPLVGPPPKAKKELQEISDSGIGSSLHSMASLEKLPSRSTLSPFQDSQSTMARSNSPGNSYGDCLQSGGYGVYGNVTVNNQYLGFMPSHNASLRNLQSAEAVPRQLESTFQQLGGATSRQSRPDYEGSFQNTEEEGPEETDCEMQQAEMEIRALGLEDYCNIFRL